MAGTGIVLPLVKRTLKLKGSNNGPGKKEESKGFLFLYHLLAFSLRCIASLGTCILLKEYIEGGFLIHLLCSQAYDPPIEIHTWKSIYVDKYFITTLQCETMANQIKVFFWILYF